MKSHKFTKRPLQQATQKVASVMNTDASPIPVIRTRNQFRLVQELHRNPCGMTATELQLKTGIAGIEDAIVMLNVSGWQIEKRNGKYHMPAELQKQARRFLGGFL